MNTTARVHVLRDRTLLLGLENGGPLATEPVRAEAVVLKVNQQSARVRLLGGDEQITFRSSDVWKVVPGHQGAVLVPLAHRQVDSTA